MQLPFELDSRSTHSTPEEFYASLSDNQKEFFHFLQWFRQAEPEDAKNNPDKLLTLLIDLWNDNHEIHHVISSVANDYWRQFAYWRQPFEMLHLGQQLHVLGCVYNMARAYINEHNMVKRGDLNHNDITSLKNCSTNEI